MVKNNNHHISKSMAMQACKQIGAILDPVRKPFVSEDKTRTIRAFAIQYDGHRILASSLSNAYRWAITLKAARMKQLMKAKEQPSVEAQIAETTSAEDSN